MRDNAVRRQPKRLPALTLDRWVSAFGMPHKAQLTARRCHATGLRNRVIARLIRWWQTCNEVAKKIRHLA